MTDKELKQIFESKKEDLMSTLKNQATYKNWDKHSSIWGYNILTSDIEEITDEKYIESILTHSQPFGKFFLNKKDAETYKWMIDLIEGQIEEELSSGRYFKNYVSVKDLNLGDENVYYTSDYEEQCKGALDEYFRETKYSAIRTNNKLG